MCSKSLHKKGLRPNASVSATIDRTPELTPEQESELILKAQQGDHAARQQVIQANLAWICSLGGTFSGRGLEDDELLSEGAIGLSEAIDRWKPGKESSIRTYGQYWIRKLQGESLFSTDPIRIPKSAHEQTVKLKNAQRKLGEEATVSELAQQTQIREKRIIELQSISQPSSLNLHVGRGEKTEILDLQMDKSCEPTDLPLSSELQSLIQRLGPRQQEVIRLRFLEGWTFKDIGDFFNLTSQRIQQICKTALADLKGWLMGVEDQSVGKPLEPQQRWQHYIFAKIILATKFCRRSLKQKPQKDSCHSLVPLPRLNTLSQSQSNQDFAIEHRPPCSVGKTQYSYAEIFTNHIDTGGLRDGPKHLLDYFWHGLTCIAQFLGYSPGSPPGVDQYRRHSGNPWQCRGGTERYKKKKVKLRNYPKFPLFHYLWFRDQNKKPKIEYRDTIVPFLRNSIFRPKVNYINVSSLYKNKF